MFRRQAKRWVLIYGLKVFNPTVLAFLRFFYTLAGKRCSTLGKPAFTFMHKPLGARNSLVPKVS